MLLDVRLDAELAAVPRVVAELGEAGVSGVFTYEGPHDPFLPLAVAAGSGLDLYTNLAIAFPRSPMHLAHLAHDLQLASSGRFSLGLGTQVRAHIEHRYGATWAAPVEQMREWVLALRAIEHSWATGEPLHFEGRWTRHTYCPPLFVPPPAPPAPILLGGLGPRMVDLAVEVADGLLVHPFCTDASVATLITSRVPAGFSVIGQAIVAVSDDDLGPALAAARALVAFYASTPAYRRVLDVHGWGSLQPELRALTKQGRWGELAAGVPDEVLDAVVISGTPAAVAAGLLARFPGSPRVALSTPHPVSTEHLAVLAAELRGA